MGLVQVRLSSACLRRGCFFLPLVERSSNHLGFVVLPANFHIQNRTRRRICWRHVGQGNVFAQSRGRRTARHYADVFSGSVRAAILVACDSAIDHLDRKSTRLNSSHGYISYAVFCLKKKKTYKQSSGSSHTPGAANASPTQVGAATDSDSTVRPTSYRLGATRVLSSVPTHTTVETA